MSLHTFIAHFVKKLFQGLIDYFFPMQFKAAATGGLLAGTWKDTGEEA